MAIECYGHKEQQILTHTHTPYNTNLSLKYVQYKYDDIT